MDVDRKTDNLSTSIDLVDIDRKADNPGIDMDIVMDSDSKAWQDQ